MEYGPHSVYKYSKTELIFQTAWDPQKITIRERVHHTNSQFQEFDVNHKQWVFGGDISIIHLKICFDFSTNGGFILCWTKVDELKRCGIEIIIWFLSPKNNLARKTHYIKAVTDPYFINEYLFFFIFTVLFGSSCTLTGCIYNSKVNHTVVTFDTEAQNAFTHLYVMHFKDTKKALRKVVSLKGFLPLLVYWKAESNLLQFKQWNTLFIVGSKTLKAMFNTWFFSPLKKRQEKNLRNN